MVIWCEQLAEAIRTLLKTRLRYQNADWSAARPMWLDVKPEDWDSIRRMIRAVRDHKIWGERTNPEILQALTSTIQSHWHEILVDGRFPGRVEQMFPKLDQNFIFQAGN